MKVVALEPGFDGICVREKGEVFEWPHSEPGAWMKVIEKVTGLSFEELQAVTGAKLIDATVTHA